MYRIETEISIPAPAELVWDILCDLDHYQDWNPFIISAKGALEVGGNLKIRMHPPGAREQDYDLTITEMVAEKVLAWRGKMFFPWILQGDHYLELEDSGQGHTVLRHYENFTGLLVPFVAHFFLDTKLKQGFMEMNEALVGAAGKRT